MKLFSAHMMTLVAAPVLAEKAWWEYRTTDDIDTLLGCVNPTGDKVRYLQVEVFDYNTSPRIKATWRQVSDECGLPLADGAPGFERSMEYRAGTAVSEESVYWRNYGAQTRPNFFPSIGANDRLQMDMYVCAPWGDYELILEISSTNGGNAMERVAWEIEYGPDEYHTWDTLNTPYFTTRNNGNPSSNIPGYAPIPPEGETTTYTFPIPGSQAYYSNMYSGPFPPLTTDDCPNLLPDGVQEYVGCFDAAQYDQASSGWSTADEPTGTANGLDQAEPYRMFDGLGGTGDNGVDTEGVMTLDKCAEMCEGSTYFGLQSAIMCRCGDALFDQGSKTSDCDLEDDEYIPEHEFLCSGDARVLCGTNTKISIYSYSDTPPSPTTEAAVTPEPTTVAPTDVCSNGVEGIEGTNEKGSVCCPVACGRCGGSGCGQAPGGRDECCIGRALSVPQPLCSETSTAPCIIDGDSPTPSPVAVASTCQAVVIEAEDLLDDSNVDGWGSWEKETSTRAIGGQYIAWRGLTFQDNNQAPADIITYEVNIPSPGTYRFKWRMRQPTDVLSDRANDSWLLFPDAARFGPDSGGSYGGWVKVFGNNRSLAFMYLGRADVDGVRSEVTVEFGEAGPTNMMIAGRSHDHQIDQIVLYQGDNLEDAVDTCDRLE